jgi:hypothetical protein
LAFEKKLPLDYEAGVSPSTARLRYEVVLPFSACQQESVDSFAHQNTRGSA